MLRLKMFVCTDDQLSKARKLKGCAETSQGIGREGGCQSGPLAFAGAPEIAQRVTWEVRLKYKSAGGRGPVVVVKPRPRCAHPECREPGMVRCPIHLDLRCPVHFRTHAMGCRVAPRLPGPMPAPE